MRDCIQRLLAAPLQSHAALHEAEAQQLRKITPQLPQPCLCAVKQCPPMLSVKSAPCTNSQCKTSFEIASCIALHPFHVLLLPLPLSPSISTPCLALQPGLIQIGTLNVVAPPNPKCLCCPDPLPQFFNLGLEAMVCAAPAPAPPAAPGAGPPVRVQTNKNGCFWDRYVTTPCMVQKPAVRTCGISQFFCCNASYVLS